MTLSIERELKGLGLSAPEGHLLSYVRRYGPSPMGELTRVFGHRKSTLTSMVDRLCERGLMARQVNPEDRRSFVVSTTARAGRLVEAGGAVLRRLEGAVRRRVSRAAVQGFGEVLEAIAASSAVQVRPADSSRSRKERA